MNIHFEKANKVHENIIFAWLAEPHIQEFWDNSKEHRDDILNFIYHRPQTYFAGTTQYWVGYVENEPYSFILSDILEKEQDDLTDTHLKYMSQTGHTISLDFGIGSIKYLGQGLGATTLIEFMKFYRNNVDPKADTFFIDPDENNPRAVHVYSKAGFAKVGQYDVSKGAFIGSKSELMVKSYRG